jgi:hypothetical protein
MQEHSHLQIQSILTHPDVKRHLAEIKTQWIFTLQKAPWWGGMYEWMIKSVKRCLRKTIGKAKLTYDELLTAITEVEMIINCRPLPLSYTSSEDIVITFNKWTFRSVHKWCVIFSARVRKNTKFYICRINRNKWAMDIHRYGCWRQLTIVQHFLQTIWTLSIFHKFKGIFLKFRIYSKSSNNLLFLNLTWIATWSDL